jgi:hypothetical protein
MGAAGTGWSKMDETLDRRHRLWQSEVQNAAWRLIKAHDRKAFCFCAAETICVWLSNVVIGPALRDIFQKAFEHMPGRKPVRPPGGSAQQTNTAGK